jgi:hypothetical protein
MAVVIGGAGALGVGCSLLVGVDGLAGPIDAASSSEGGSTSEGGPTLDSSDKDAPATTDAGADADTHVGPNLLDESSFESGCTWNGFQGTSATDSTTAHTGTKSCRVCTSPFTTDYFTGNSHYTNTAPAVGATYRAVAWVRTAPGAAVPPNAVLNLRTLDPSPFTGIEAIATAATGSPLTDTWRSLEITLAVTKAAATMDVFVATNTVPGSCFLIDDVWLEKLP